MQQIPPLELIPGEFYYIENKKNKKDRSKAKFTKYQQMYGSTMATFTNISAVKKMNPNSKHGWEISVAPHGCEYNFYRALKDSILARKDEEARIKAFEKMINQQKLPFIPDKISASTMFAETQEEKNPPFIEDDQTFYGTSLDKTNLGTQLKHTYIITILQI